MKSGFRGDFFGPILCVNRRPARSVPCRALDFRLPISTPLTSVATLEPAASPSARSTHSPRRLEPERRDSVTERNEENEGPRSWDLLAGTILGGVDRSAKRSAFAAFLTFCKSDFCFRVESSPAWSPGCSTCQPRSAESSSGSPPQPRPEPLGSTSGPVAHGVHGRPSPSAAAMVLDQVARPSRAHECIEPVFDSSSWQYPPRHP